MINVYFGSARLEEVWATVEPVDGIVSPETFPGPGHLALKTNNSEVTEEESDDDVELFECELLESWAVTGFLVGKHWRPS